MARSIKKGPFVDQHLLDKVAAARDPVSPWGTLSKGYKTRKNKRTDAMIIRRRNAKVAGG